MAVLLTGGTGNTGSYIAKHLLAANVPFLVASRRGAAATPSPELQKHMVKFDFADEKTWENPFTSPVKAVYTVLPSIQDTEKMVNAFIDLAVRKGVKRFVVLGGSSAIKGGPFAGSVWQHLSDFGDKVEFSMVNPNWFTDNLLNDGMALRPFIRRDSTLYSATKGAKIPFVTVKDIGEVAYHALTSEKPLGETLTLFGPERLTYAEVAAKIGKAIGKDVKYKEVDEKTRIAQYEECGVPAQIAGFLVYLETWDYVTRDQTSVGVVESVCGRKATSVDEWLAEYAEQLK